MTADTEPSGNPREAEWREHVAASLAAGRCPDSGEVLHREGEAGPHAASCDMCDCFGYDPELVKVHPRPLRVVRWKVTRRSCGRCSRGFSAPTGDRSTVCYRCLSEALGLDNLRSRIAKDFRIPEIHDDIRSTRMTLDFPQLPTGYGWRVMRDQDSYFPFDVHVAIRRDTLLGRMHEFPIINSIRLDEDVPHEEWDDRINAAAIKAWDELMRRRRVPDLLDGITAKAAEWEERLNTAGRP